MKAVKVATYNCGKLKTPDKAREYKNKLEENLRRIDLQAAWLH
jgi:hypothetical protein